MTGMHDDRALVEARLDRVLRERLRPAVYPRRVPLEVSGWTVPGEPVPVAEALAADFAPLASGTPWGRPWGTTWLRLTGEVPSGWAGRIVEAVIDLGFGTTQPGFSAEGLVYRADGTAVRGLHPYQQWVRVAAPAAGGEPVELYVEAAANPVISGPVTPLGDLDTAGAEPLYRLGRIDLAVFDETVWELVNDLEVLGQLMRELDVADPRRYAILRAIAGSLDALRLTDIGESAAAARAILAGVLAQPAHASAHRLSAVGHAHIDSAWLWPLRETVRKVARTASNVTALMDDAPEFVFAMSQAQQLAWIRDHHPAVYRRVRDKAAGGQFVPVGGMWVESDTNLPGGEALARQFVCGQRFLREEFGAPTDTVWLPDSFGYSAALPQLIRLAGARWFLTQKISWNQTNRFPHHTFWWEGLDGTRVFTHFPPVDTYNSELAGFEIARAVRNFAEKGRATRSLVPFGYGDGGGGPTREMLARAHRLASLEGSARVAVEPPAEFFAAAHAEYPDAPVWVGELYLELHRGTYTTQAKIKQGNRRSEHLLREAELWAATAAVRAGYAYPYDALDRIWKTVLLHQFHDILPGSSIAWVNREAREVYAAVAAELESMVDSALSALGGSEPTGVVFNAAPFARDGVPALGAGVPRAGGATRVAVRPDGTGFVLDNDLVRVVVDHRGLVTSVEAGGREAVPPAAAANLLQLHPDLPNYWDAWDIDAFYRDTVTDLVDVADMSTMDNGVRVVRSFGASTVTQVLSLRPGARQLDVDTEVDWHERETVLKAAFPIDVHADRSAAETQFGHVYRATHTNTSWEAARFEICAHRFLHVAEPGWGAAVVNDSTYGHDVTRDVRDDGGVTTTVRLTLLRAPRFPDPQTDQGRHRFRYALVPGATLADAVRAGHEINLPPREVPGGPVAPLVAVDSPDRAVVVSAVKLADDRSGDVIVRLYESLGGRAAATLRAGFPAATATLTDLLEDPLPDGPELTLVDRAVALRLRPFQIVTVRLRRA